MRDTEEDRWRGKPPVSYKDSGLVLKIGPECLAVTLKLLQRFGRSEACVFWFGLRSDYGGEVRGVVAPQQRMTWGNFDVTAEAMLEMADRVDGRDWRPLAQVHSHPGRGVEHSWYDDKMIASKRALSIVFPLYGNWAPPWPADIGIHEWQNGFWHLLPFSAAVRRVIVCGDLPLMMVEDLR